MAVDSKSNVHFTYKSSPNMTTLCQGDVLQRTEDLTQVLKEVHPYFLNEQYKYFMVLSQSCDLVRRNGSTCKTPYITLAAIKSYNDFIEKKLVKEKYAEIFEGFLIMDEKKKERAYQLIERIYNNTEPEYFFLYKDDTLHFSESMIAFLKLSIAIKSSEHYEKCLNAKIIELSDEFKAKLGWLVGNMYSRVGTSDWEEIMTSQARKDMLNNDLSSICIIGTKEQIKQFKTKYSENKDIIHNKTEAMDVISKIKVETNYDIVMRTIEDVVKTTSKQVPEEDKVNLIKAIRSRHILKTLIK